MQSPPAGGGAEEAALESLECRVAKYSANHRAVMDPLLLGCRLVPGSREHRADASLIGLAVFSLQRGRDCAEGGRVYSVARPLELDAFKAVRHLVHLEENHHRHPAERLVAQNDIGVAITKIQCAGQPGCTRAKLEGQLSRRFIPVGLAQYIFHPIRGKCRRRQGSDRHCNCNPDDTDD